ncbi:phosphoribosylaminoimidazolesuccinocarboxamide synthase [Rapidithrix thailandica]|uniref:Phosphoribosylaminoimidazole-succinocarboxamide synthase n=1 Tax=Rapidithrix thailandica TaxID=413964 RepID=A0AAW9SL25_9BACT
MEAIKETQLEFSKGTGEYKGKVRDIYYFGDKLAMIASDRISAFDVVLPKAIPYKGQVLNTIASKFLEMTKEIVPNWVEAVPHPNVTVGKRCQPIPIEMVIRGYLTGHAWREYKAGKRTLCGVPMPEGLNENDPFPKPIITPATKAMDGEHDEDISREEILKREIVSPEIYTQLEAYTQKLFAFGQEFAKKMGLILVDTKYEFGIYEGKVYLIDEVHTPDSSRYFYSEGYEERQQKGEVQKQLSKEFVRQWLIENGFQGLEGQSIPEIQEEFVEQVSQRYIELYERITGENFVKTPYDNILADIKTSIESVIEQA